MHWSSNNQTLLSQEYFKSKWRTHTANQNGTLRQSIETRVMGFQAYMYHRRDYSTSASKSS